MKKKTKKIFALILALALVVGVCIFANGVVGNPLSKWLATNTAKNRLAEVYADKDYEIEELLKKASLRKDGKTDLYDGRTGDKFAKPITVGVMYMMKLHHSIKI